MIFVLKISEIGIITGLAIVLLIVSMTSIGIINNKNELIQSISLENEELLDNTIKNYNNNLFLEGEIERLESDYKILEDNYKILEDNYKVLQNDYKILEVERDKIERSVEKSIGTNRGSTRKVLLGTFEATAYDLSVASCGKSESHPAYGITANGTSLKGHTLESARAIAVDPKVIKLGSTVYVEFLDEGYKHLTGEFQAVDTGGAIKGSKIDVFFGSDNVTEEVKQFGRRKVKVWIVK